MLWRSCILVTLLESAVTKNAPAKPVECAITKLLDLKSFEINTCGKWGGVPPLLWRAAWAPLRQG